jgi:hypothetical protein
MWAFKRYFRNSIRGVLGTYESLDPLNAKPFCFAAGHKITDC